MTKRRFLPLGPGLAGLLLILSVSGDRLSAQLPTQRSAESVPQLDRLLRWLENVQRHTPGEPDLWAIEIGGWPRADLEDVVADIGKLSAFLERSRQGKGGSRPTLALHDRRFTVSEVEEIFAGNSTLRRGAGLHADVAMFVPEDASRRVSQMASRTFVVQDGRQQGVRYNTGHWQLARMLLEEITPSPANDAGALLWYRACSAFLLRERHFDEAKIHLTTARQVFPGSWEILLDSGYLHQKFSSPAIQAAVLAMSGDGIKTDVGSQRTELERAERFFRQTLAINAGSVEARIRLGRVLGQLERHQDAAAELTEALGESPAGELRYFAALLLGREELALGQFNLAREHFQTAADLYPRAQSPHLALSQLARQSGDRKTALDALRKVTVLPASELVRADPWWRYYDSHDEDADDLLRNLYETLRRDRR